MQRATFVPSEMKALVAVSHSRAPTEQAKSDGKARELEYRKTASARSRTRRVRETLPRYICVETFTIEEMEEDIVHQAHRSYTQDRYGS